MILDDIALQLTDEQWEEEYKKAELEYKMAKLADGSLFLEEVNGVRETLHFDEGAQTFAVKRVEDVEPIFEAAQRSFNEGRVNKRSEFPRLGSYPVTVLEQFAQRWGFGRDYWAALKHKDLFYRLIEERDYSKFRTIPGTFTRRGY